MSSRGDGVAAGGGITSLLEHFPKDLQFVRVLTVPAKGEDDSEPPLRRAILAGLLDAGVREQPVAILWARPEPWAPLEVLAAGVVGPTASAADAEVGAPLFFPLGATGCDVSTKELDALLGVFDHWVPCVGKMEALLRDDSQPTADVEWSSSPFDDVVSYLAHQAFAWLVICHPRPEDSVQEELEALRRSLYGLRQKAKLLEAEAIEVERQQARFRELTRAGAGGVWDVAVLVGVKAIDGVPAVASILCSAAERSVDLYRIRPVVETLDSIRDTARPRLTTDTGSFPFSATSDLVAALVRPPETELPGVRLVAPPCFDTSPEPFRGRADRVDLGRILDRHLRPTSALEVSLDTLNRHTFVCGATGGGKSQTVRGLLERLSRHDPPIPWLVVEPAKAEYARMAGRLLELEMPVTVIAPGDVTAPPGSVNPLEPASLEPGNPDKTYPLQSHADLVRALFMAAFRVEEPLPQVLQRALTECYERAGWDLVTGESLFSWDTETGQPVGGSDSRATPRYPNLRDLQAVAQTVVDDIGYDEDAKKRVKGFVDVRIGSLRLGTPGRFFEGGHPLDFAALLQQNVVFEIENVTNDQDRAFVMGAVLIRLYEQLLLREKQRFAQENVAAPFQHVTVIEEAHRLLRSASEESPAAHAVELFASLLAEVRSYGEGIVIAEQIPNKLIPDAIKNTALKVVHRLPAADDREAVGATMNLTKEQSEYVVTLEPGCAAVFMDGMDRPILARMPLGEKKESSDAAIRTPPLIAHRRRSRACGELCKSGDACTLLTIRHAERLLDSHPELTFWMEMACAAHILGMGPPSFTNTQQVEELRERAKNDPRLVECAIAHAAERALAARHDLVREFYDPQALVEHLAAVATHAICPGDSAESCGSDRGKWRAGAQRFADIELHLAEAAEKGQAPDERVAKRARERGLALRGDGAKALLLHLRSLPWKRYPGERQRNLLVGTHAPTGLYRAATGLVGESGDEKDRVTAAMEYLEWPETGSGKADPAARLLRLLYPAAQVASQERET